MSLLPGQLVRLEGDETCGVHGDRNAVAKIVTEADSFGVETEAMCAECWEAYRLTPNEDTIGSCRWCPAENVPLFPCRDPEEGSHGPVYMVCSSCRSKKQEPIEEWVEGQEDEDEYLPPVLDDEDSGDVINADYRIVDDDDNENN